MTEAISGAVSALVAALLTFMLTRRATLSDRREKRAEYVEDKRERRLAAIEGSLERLGDDLYDGFAQLAQAVPAFHFQPRSGRRR